MVHLVRSLCAHSSVRSHGPNFLRPMLAGYIEPSQLKQKFRQRRFSAKIRLGKVPNPFTHRQVYRNGWTSLSSADEVRSATEILEEHNFLRAVETPPPSIVGGRPTTLYAINPRLKVKGVR